MHIFYSTIHVKSGCASSTPKFTAYPSSGSEGGAPGTSHPYWRRSYGVRHAITWLHPVCAPYIRKSWIRACIRCLYPSSTVICNKGSQNKRIKHHQVQCCNVSSTYCDLALKLVKDAWLKSIFHQKCML